MKTKLPSTKWVTTSNPVILTTGLCGVHIVSSWLLGNLDFQSSAQLGFGYAYFSSRECYSQHLFCKLLPLLCLALLIVFWARHVVLVLGKKQSLYAQRGFTVMQNTAFRTRQMGSSNLHRFPTGNMFKLEYKIFQTVSHHRMWSLWQVV